MCLPGINPATLTEFRAFLDFPLTGAGGVPGNAIIDSAFLDIHIDSLQPGVGTIPILIELVSFQPPTLLETDFDRTLQPPLASVVVSPPISQADVGTNVSIDVTPLMVEAQNLGLVDFQVRIMEDLGPAIPVLMEIDDTTGSESGHVRAFAHGYLLLRVFAGSRRGNAGLPSPEWQCSIRQ